MSLTTKPKQPPSRGGDGPPAWFVFILGVALIFGLYYLWQGARDFLRTGGGGVVESTERAVIIATATAVRQRPTLAITPGPSTTPIPECQDFVVTAGNARVREAPNTESNTVTSFSQGEIVCVLGRDPDSEWYTVDSDPSQFRMNLAYMHESVIQALNPTPRPSRTPTALPTVTPGPTDTPTATLPPSPTSPLTDIVATAQMTPTPPPTVTNEPSVPMQSA